MFCSTCGNNYDDSAAFCPICGAANNSVAPQPVEEAPVEVAPVEVAPVMKAPVEVAPVMETPVEAAPVMTAPVMTAPTFESAPAMDIPGNMGAPAPQGQFFAPAPQADFAAPAQQPKKKSKLPLILGIAGAGLVALVAVIIFVVVPMFSSPTTDISEAVRKTLFETSGVDFTVEVDGETVHGSISIGEGVDDSGFYYADEDGIGEGFADGTMYDPYSGEIELTDEMWDYMDEGIEENGFDISAKDSIDGILNNKLDEAAIKDIYNNNIGDIESSIADKTDEEVALPDWDETQSFLADFFKDGLSENAMTIEKSKRDGNKVYAYDINPQAFAEDFCAYAKDDERAADLFEFVAVYVYGCDDVDEFIEELADADLTDEIGNITGEIIINGDGYIVEFSIDADGEELVVKLSNFNSTDVTLDLIKEEVYYEYEDEYYDDYDDNYDDSYDDYYDENSDYMDGLDYHYYDSSAYIMADVSSLYLEYDETGSVLIECWGDDVPADFTFNVQYPDGVEVEWGDWLSDGMSCYLYVTAIGSCYGDTMIIELIDENDNVYDFYEVAIYVE